MLTRRDLMAAMLAADPISIIDTHTHFYDPSRAQGVPWPPKGDATLYRTVLPPEFEKLAQPHGVAATVVIEASPWYDDNAWLLELAARYKVIAGVVGNLKIGTAEFLKGMAEFTKTPLFRGIRTGPAAIGQVEDLKRLAGADLTLDLIGAGNRVGDIVRLHDQIPSLRIVIDHLPVEGSTNRAEWQDLRGRSTIFAKVSHTLRRAGDKVEEDLEGMARVWDVFGEDRVLYGSNWPVSDKLAPYGRVFETPKKFFSAKGTAAERKYFHDNALRAYGLTVR